VPATPVTTGIYGLMIGLMMGLMMLGLMMAM
jgi:hypothetical protein